MDNIPDSAWAAHAGLEARDEARQLQRRVAELEARLAAVEARLAGVEAQAHTHGPWGTGPKWPVPVEFKQGTTGDPPPAPPTTTWTRT